MSEKDYLSTGQEYKFDQHQMDEIRKNRANLTREGIEKKIEMWKGKNKICFLKYSVMLKGAKVLNPSTGTKEVIKCEKYAESGKTHDGRIIFSRTDDGSPKWTDESEEMKQRKKLGL